MPLRPTCARVPNRALLSVSGAHAHQFLHGILAQGPPTPASGGFFTTFLHPQGRVLYDAFVYRNPISENNDDGYLVEYDSRSSEAPPLLSVLKRYVLRSKVKIRDVTPEWDVWSTWGIDIKPDNRMWRWSRSGSVEPIWVGDEWPWGGVRDHFLINDRRMYGMGRRRLVPKGDKSPDTSDCDLACEEDYIRHRTIHGVPEGVDDIPPMQAFPMESNLDVMGAIDFRKGCYVGQELTVRTYHTGVVRKRILPIEIHSLDPSISAPSTPFPLGLDIRPVVQATPEGRVPRQRGTGKLLTNFGNIGLALLRLEHVEALTKGTATLQLETGQVGQDKQKWGVTYRWPPGWPQPGVNEVEV